MTDPTDPEEPGPFPTAIPASPFPPRGQEMAPAQGAGGDLPSDWNAGADAHDLSVGHEMAPRNALVALGRFAFPPGPPPDDEGVAARDRRWTTRAIAFATLLMLVFNAASIQNWSRQQPPGWITSTVQQLGDVWSAQLTQLGADRPRQAVRDAWVSFQRLGFDGRKRPDDTAA
ncbi:hypothetical protein [Brevundimonas sp. NIBR10]|uniref:hypothetical protein n=1 Tax=Brevundimonas sp. NIBR10 TaxID=3015997 RepID=UPI0022F15F7A|nr:hypothetical protein [Brevundimonas sp. NIBR10]